MTILQTYAVWYRPADMLPEESDLAFGCQAEDAEHAREQCSDAEPNARITRVELQPAY